MLALAADNWPTAVETVAVLAFFAFVARLLFRD